MRRTWAIAVAALIQSAGVSAQDSTSIAATAEQARVSWHAHDARGLMASAAQGVQVQLPGADPSGPVSREQGAALLSEYLENAEEVATVVRAARVVSPQRGFVELGRRYRVAGTREERTGRVLLSYRQDGGEWVLVELRVGPD